MGAYYEEIIDRVTEGNGFSNDDWTYINERAAMADTLFTLSAAVNVVLGEVCALVLINFYRGVLSGPMLIILAAVLAVRFIFRVPGIGRENYVNEQVVSAFWDVITFRAEEAREKKSLRGKIND